MDAIRMPEDQLPASGLQDTYAESNNLAVEYADRHEYRGHPFRDTVWNAHFDAYKDGYAHGYAAGYDYARAHPDTERGEWGVLPSVLYDAKPYTAADWNALRASLHAALERWWAATDSESAPGDADDSATPA